MYFGIDAHCSKQLNKTLGL